MTSAETLTTLAFITALGTSLVMMPLLRNLALAKGRTDLPGPRKIHDRPVPRLGGVGLFVAFWAGLLWFAGFAGFSQLLSSLLAGGGIIFLTGLFDDLRGITARQKLVGEMVACLVTMAIGGFWINDLGNLFGFGQILLPPWLGIPFTLFAVVGVINAINLIDGLDGLAGGLSVIVLTAFGVLALQAGDSDVMLVCFSLGGALLGFLRYNLRPAHLFMGDAGSLTLGFLLGFLAVHLTQQPEAPAGPMAPVLILALPVIDAVRVMILRKLRGRNSFSADRSHVHHLLLDLGLTQRSAVAVLLLVTAVAAVLGITGRSWPAWQLLLLLITATAVMSVSVAARLRAVGRERAAGCPVRFLGNR